MFVIQASNYVILHQGNVCSMSSIKRLDTPLLLAPWLLLQSLDEIIDSGKYINFYSVPWHDFFIWFDQVGSNQSLNLVLTDP